MPILVVVALLAAAPAWGASAQDSKRTTFLLSRAVDGGFANGPSRNPVVSHDQRYARWMAFESDASNLVEGDANGFTDVFVVRRAAPYGRNGTPWAPGPLQNATAGANGRSFGPSLDGDAHHRPRCLAFVSEASNLVGGDTNGVADAFVRDLDSGAVTRVSVGTGGREANGATHEVSIDGACERVAFISEATNLAHGGGGPAAWRTARTSAPAPGVRQAYVRVIGGEGHDRGFRGLTFLASASDRGRPANAGVRELTIARDGKSVAFTTAAANLDRRDLNRADDVYLRRFTRKFVHLGHGRGMQTLRFDTRLVSATDAGRSGNGPSRHPSLSDTGRFVAYETDATNLLARDSNGVTDIARADMARARPVQAWVSRSAHSGVANAASARPVISGAGEFVLFDSEATNLKPSASVRSDPNKVRDVFLWNANTGNVSLESRDSRNGYLQTPSHSPATSSRGNYVPFLSDNPPLPPPDPPPPEEPPPGLLDILFPKPKPEPKRKEPKPEPQFAATGTEPGAPAPASPQVYVRYLGPE